MVSGTLIPSEALDPIARVSSLRTHQKGEVYRDPEPDPDLYRNLNPETDLDQARDQDRDIAQDPHLDPDLGRKTVARLIRMMILTETKTKTQTQT